MKHTTSTQHLGELTLTSITFTQPLSADPQDERSIDVFARVVTGPGGENKPYLLFLQGGPGVEAPRPCAQPAEPSWLPTALEHYQVVMLDQRGTGNSSPVDERILEGRSAEEVAEYLTHLRADGIVRDAEALRTILGVDTWCTLGQSFGGFSTLHYISTHPESLDTCYFTGGLSAVGRTADEVYTECYRRMRRNSEEFYRRFPQLRETMRDLVEAARAGQIVLPDGEVVSETRLRSLGHCLGSDDGWLKLYQLLQLDPSSSQFAYDLAGLLPYGGRNPLYYVLHESSYADGVVTNWAAQRCMPQEFKDDPTLLLGEHVFKEWSETVPAFQPWAEVAEILAEHEWPSLYDAEALKASGVRGAAAVYANDVFVPLNFSLDTGELLDHVKLYITSEYEHGGLRTSQNGAVLRHLFDLATDRRVR
ncbi:Proline iminopeptidase [Corynebacterium ciconiae DSM 44920]|uniref:alpha/beta fold hydrolase n=1 Tax=Corynebacterium ciconiae TaxID=227319 RepID=UPI00037487F9|nr:alpha/beta fold hydrolase [Corynebacterium ciconiae]WKD61634.1 Proline iminopeptidase [Corynebacterium ciconiae DSM 44920]